jgi:NAD(P)-dependent dehydrogenase (short-subunit alcohol dehydrogenase family)
MAGFATSTRVPSSAAVVRLWTVPDTVHDAIARDRAAAVDANPSAAYANLEVDWPRTLHVLQHLAWMSSMSPTALAIVTGASGNLGRAVLARLATSGLSIASVEHSTLHLGEELVCSIDLADADSVSRAFAEASRRSGPLLAVVHTVGIYRGGRTLIDSPDADFLELYQTNVLTTLHVLQGALQLMQPQRQGRIAVVASSDALLGPAAHAAYAASKAAQLRVVESAAAEAKQYGIGINAILPGTMDTPQNRAAMPMADRSAWLQLSDVANVLAYLVSPESAAIHGQALRL